MVSMQTKGYPTSARNHLIFGNTFDSDTFTASCTLTAVARCMHEDICVCGGGGVCVFVCKHVCGVGDNRGTHPLMICTDDHALTCAHLRCMGVCGCGCVHVHGYVHQRPSFPPSAAN